MVIFLIFKHRKTNEIIYLDALKTFDTSRQTMPNVQRLEQLRDTARNTRDLIKQRATHYIDCYRVER